MSEDDKAIRLSEEIERRLMFNRLAPFPVYDTEIINDLKIRENMLTKKDNYNNVPVTYCKTCGSLHIKTVEFHPTESGEEREVSYCVPCGNTDLADVRINEWEEIYEEMHGEKFLKLPKDV
tara:strand:- start:4327 stop:4689 length:363 start_codon:yes stop_codon:yes gene_type:complete